MEKIFGNFKARNDSDKSFQKEIKNLEENNKSLNICFVNLLNLIYSLSSYNSCIK